MTAIIQVRRFESPDEALDMKDAGGISIVRMSDGTAGMLAVFEPGWTWEKDEKPLLGSPLKEYTKATYSLWFEQGQFCGGDPNLSASIEQAGQDPGRVLSEASSEAIVTALHSATEEAMDLGVFGAPTFVVGKELFWGNDRMEDAVCWANTGRLAPRPLGQTNRL